MRIKEKNLYRGVNKKYYFYQEIIFFVLLRRKKEEFWKISRINKYKDNYVLYEAIISAM